MLLSLLNGQNMVRECGRGPTYWHINNIKDNVYAIILSQNYPLEKQREYILYKWENRLKGSWRCFDMRRSLFGQSSPLILWWQDTLQPPGNTKNVPVNMDVKRCWNGNIGVKMF